MNITAQRLKDALYNANLSQQELANLSGVAKASISHYTTGRFAPSNVSAEKMARVLDVSPLWLMGFDVPMNREAILTENAFQCTIKKLKQLNAIGRAKVDTYIDDLVESGKYED